jgi:hypothetical protein
MLNKLQKLVPDVKIKSTKKTNRINICDEIRSYLLYLEKYSTSKDKNKNTYMMIPADHPTLAFPYNLEDRVKYILNQVKSIIQREYNYNVLKGKNSTFNDFNLSKLPSYIIDIKINKYIESNMKKLLDLGFKKDSNKLIFIIE